MYSEDFLGFVHAKDLTGEGLATLLLDSVAKVGLDMSKCVGLGFDGASAMMGKYNGCATIIQRKFPGATPVHCFNHRLNLVLSKACETKEVKLALHTMTEVYNFIYASNMRSLRFGDLLKETLPQKRRQKLVQLCPTRWAERHDAVQVFVELLPAVALFLEQEAENDGRAGLLLIALRESKFLVGLLVADSVLAHTVSASKTLQSRTGDLVNAYKTIESIQTAIDDQRNRAEETFQLIFHRVEELLTDVGSENATVPLPRVCGRQTQRSNVEASSAEEYYRRSVFLPFIDFVASELRRRFGDASAHALLFVSELLKGPSMDVENFMKAVDASGQGETLARAEAERWRKTAPAFDRLTDAHEYHALPVTNAEAERSLSTLKRLKTYLRSTMTQERVNGLALLAVHKEVTVDTQLLIDRFAQKNRRLMFV